MISSKDSSRTIPASTSSTLIFTSNMSDEEVRVIAEAMEDKHYSQDTEYLVL